MSLEDIERELSSDNASPSVPGSAVEEAEDELELDYETNHRVGELRTDYQQEDY